jgi:hypothetical protein
MKKEGWGSFSLILMSILAAGAAKLAELVTDQLTKTKTKGRSRRKNGKKSQ